MTLAIRPAVPEDRRFLVDAWARSFQFAHSAGMIAVENWFAVMIPEIERVLDRPDAQTFVAFEPSDDTRLADIYGFIVFDPVTTPPTVFYVYVKEPYRRSGIARRLFTAAAVDPEKPFVYSCTTPIVSRLYHARKIPMARWNPLVARFAKDDPRRPRSH